MADVESEHLNWRISSKSSGSNCVEVALLPGLALVRDSNNRSGAMLTVSSSGWHDFIDCIRSEDQ